MVYDASGDGKILWTRAGDGTIKPSFSNPMTESFIVHDLELSGDESLKSAVEKQYFTRDWYFLDQDDAKLWKEGKKTFKAYDEDTTKMNVIEVQMNSWRKAAELWYNWTWDPIINAHGHEGVPDDDGIRELQRIFYKDSNSMGGGYRMFLSANKKVESGTFGSVRKEGQTTVRDMWNNPALPQVHWLFATMLKNSVEPDW